MTKEEFISGLSPDEVAALIAYRDEIVSSNTAAMEALRASLEGDLSSKDATITQLQAAATTAEADHEAALAAAEQKRRDDLATLRTEHEEELARVRGEVAGSSARSLLSDLDGAFGALPEDVQLAFAAEFSTVRDLLHTNRPRVAWRYVDELTVPPELVATQAAIKGRIAQAFPEYFNEEGELIS